MTFTTDTTQHTNTNRVTNRDASHLKRTQPNGIFSILRLKFALLPIEVIIWT